MGHILTEWTIPALTTELKLTLLDAQFGAILYTEYETGILDQHPFLPMTEQMAISKQKFVSHRSFRKDRIVRYGIGGDAGRHIAEGYPPKPAQWTFR